MKENIKTLLDRREEIKNQINKLEKEYSAIGEVLTELYNYKQKEYKQEKEKENGEREL